MFDISQIGFVHRIVVGSRDPTSLRTESEISAALDELNRCLSETPKGKILGLEKSFCVLSIGEHQVVLQAVVYHVGFPRKPAWLDGRATVM